ncbi:MAG: mechanosensitive ion channel domain-containing protein [Thermodesulfobacteriota bacterium]
MDFDIDKMLNMIWGLLTVYGLRVIAGILIFVIGRWVAMLFRGGARKILAKKEIDHTISSFVINLVYYALLTFFVLAALSQIGVQTTSFIAIIGAASFAIAFSLKDSLSNFAAGFLIIIFRPFKVGDYIEGAGVAGTVERLLIFNTRLKTSDNKLIIVPNSKLNNDIITNYSVNETRRIDLIFGIKDSKDIDKARSIITDILAKDSRILKDPAPTIKVVELIGTRINLAVRPWTKRTDYWNTKCDLIETVKKALDA